MRRLWTACLLAGLCAATACSLPSAAPHRAGSSGPSVGSPVPSAHGTVAARAAPAAPAAAAAPIMRVRP
jgi:hypothetical protein